MSNQEDRQRLENENRDRQDRNPEVHDDLVNHLRNGNVVPVQGNGHNLHNDEGGQAEGRQEIPVELLEGIDPMQRAQIEAWLANAVILPRPQPNANLLAPYIVIQAPNSVSQLPNSILRVVHEKLISKIL
jgi:hypothetical protein